jgi:DNA-binding beta-propeller fold protein YncE
MKLGFALMRTLGRSAPAFLAVLAGVTLAGCPPSGPTGSPSVASVIIQGPFFGQDAFNDPTYVAIDPVTHNILVTNSEANEVDVFSSAGAPVNLFPPINQPRTNSSADGSFAWPLGVAVDPVSRNAVVADSKNNRVQIFAPSGTSWVFSAAFGSAGGGPGQFATPAGLAIDPVSRNILVADSGNNRIEVFNASGQFLSQFGSQGRNAGQFEGPQDVAVDPASRDIVVADAGNSRFQIFDVNGNHLFTVGSPGTGNGQFGANGYSPLGVAVDPTSHNIVTADTFNNRVETFSASGQFQSTFGSNGNAPGQFSFPTGIAVDAVSCNLVVDDYGNKRVQIFPPPAGEGGVPIAVTNSPVEVTNPGAITNLSLDYEYFLLQGTVSTGSCGQNSGPATVSFQYARVPCQYCNTPPSSYNGSVPATPSMIPAGLTNQPVTAHFPDACQVTLHFRLVVTTSADTVYGNDQIQYTPSCV